MSLDDNMNIKAILCFILFLLSSTYIQAEKIIHVGKTEIKIPSPDNFHEFSHISEIKDIAELVTPPNGRLLAFFTSEKELERMIKNDNILNKYMLVQVLNSFEDDNISISNFNKVKEGIKKQQGLLLKKIRPKLDSLVKTASNNLSKKYNILFEINIGNIIPLGVFLEQPHAIGFTMLSKAKRSVDGKINEHIVVGVSSAVWIKNKILFVNTYNIYKSQKDIDWAKSISKKWVGSIIETNK